MDNTLHVAIYARVSDSSQVIDTSASCSFGSIAKSMVI